MNLSREAGAAEEVLQAARAEFRAGRVDDALDLARSSLDRGRASHDDRAVVEAVDFLIGALGHLDRLDMIPPLLIVFRDAASRLDTSERARAVLAEANYLHATSRFEESLPLYATARDEAVRVEASPYLAHQIEARYGVALLRSGRVEEAIAVLAGAARALDENAQAVDRAMVRTNLGIAFFTVGRYREALHEYATALAVIEPPSEDAVPHTVRRGMTAMIRDNMAEVHLELGASREAEIAARDARETFEALGMRRQAALSALNVGRALARGAGRARASRRTQEARALFAEAGAAIAGAESIFAAEGARALALLATLERGALLLEQGETDKAETMIARAVTDSRAAKGDLRNAPLLALLVRARMARAAPEPLREAAHALRAALPPLGANLFRARAEAGLARAALLQGDSRSAHAALQRAMDALDRVREGIAADSLRTSFLGDLAEVYEDAIRLALHAPCSHREEQDASRAHTDARDAPAQRAGCAACDGDAAREVLRILARARSRGLALSVAERRMYTRRARPAALDALRERVDRAEMRLRQWSPADGLDARIAAWEEFEAAERTFGAAALEWTARSDAAPLQETSAAHERTPDGGDAARGVTFAQGRTLSTAAPMPGTPGVTFAQGRTSSRATTFLDYMIHDGRVLAVVRSAASDSERLHLERRLCSEDDLESALAEWEAEVEDVLAAGRLRHSTRAALADRQRLLLARLAECILPSGVRDSLARRNGPRGSLVISPWGALARVPFAALPVGPGVLVENADVALLSHPRPFVRAPRLPIRSGRPRGPRPVVVAVGDDLPSVRAEAHHVACALGRARVLLGRQATRAAVLDAIRCAPHVHMVCHGRFRPDNPWFSGLEVADGTITLHDVAELPLHGTSVVLSACEAAAEDRSSAEELVGLARAFIVAGASGLVGSRQPVHDRYAAQFVRLFYRAVRTRGDAVSALAAAARRAHRAGLHAAHWSTVVAVLGAV
jgi:tetratricopeptide (TPR) repeat protein